MPKTSDDPYPDWQGFDTPRYTQVPDDVFDLWLSYLSGAELKVLLYICRRTFGWKKDADAISLSQITGGICRRDGTVLDRGTGLSRSTAMLAIAGLEAKRLVIAERSPTASADRQANVYRLRVRTPAGWIENRSSPGEDWIENRSSPGSKRAPALDRKSAPQEITVQETIHKRDGEEAGSLPENDAGPSLAAILAPYGGAWALCQSQAQLVCAAHNWTPAQLAAALAGRRERGLRAKLQALAAG